MIKVEIACNSWSSCLNAIKGGAHRIELFENLADGGCTPSSGMLHKASLLSIPCYVMIRPRGGDFHYSNDEVDIMLHDIGECKKSGVAGIVFGCLTRSGEVDMVLNRKLLEAWGNGPATFHRAIDRSKDILKAARDIADLGFERILSSGGAMNVMQGLDILKKMQNDVGKEIIVMPGAGVAPQNAHEILSFTGCTEIHATCKQTFDVSIGVFNDKVQISDEKEIALLVKNVSGLQG